MFITFRLHGSLPVCRVFPPGQLTTGEAFVAMDRLLDSAASGPLYLMRPEIESTVVSALREGEQRFHRYQLHSFVVMPNHVHLLATPHVTSTQWLGPLKGYTGRKCNQIWGLQASPFGKMRAMTIWCEIAPSLNESSGTSSTTQ